MYEDGMVLEEETAPEDSIAQGDGVQETDQPESNDIPGSAATELEKLRRQLREFQSRYDKTEAELKKLRRQGMDETERLRDELTEKEQELRQYEAMVAQLMAEKRRSEIIREYSIPDDFEKFVPISYDEVEMREVARELAAKLEAISRKEERPPRTGGGVPSEAPSVDAAIGEAIKKGDARAALRLKLEKLKEKS